MSEESDLELEATKGRSLERTHVSFFKGLGSVYSIDKVTRRDWQRDRISKSSVFQEAWPWRRVLQWTVNR